MNLKVFVNLLKLSKINVDVADSGKGCLEMVVKKHYDLIFLDHMMPEMDGIQTLHNMKALKDNQCSHTPLVALTANAITGAKEMYLAEGFDAFLPKPINPEKLEQMILKLLPRELLRFDVEDGENDEVQERIQVAPAVSEVELPMVDGIDWSYGLMHLPGKELLCSAVKDFYKTLEVEADSLDEFYEKGMENSDMLAQYRIKVHSMKSSANLIGATVLGGMAKLLENAARDENVATIHAMHSYFIKEWRSYKQKLEIGVPQVVRPENEEIVEKVLLDVPMVCDYLKTLKTASEECDMDVMDEIMEKLQEFQYPGNIQSQIEKLSVYVTNLDCERIVSLISEIEFDSFLAKI